MKGTVVNKPFSTMDLRFIEFLSLLIAWTLHGLAAMSPAFQEARFNPPRPAGPFVAGNPGQQNSPETAPDIFKSPD